MDFGMTDADLKDDEKECPGTIQAMHSKCAA
jgi:hypothetical protein